MYERWLIEHKYPDKAYDIEELNSINEDLIWEMATIRQRKSGLPYKIWLDPMGVTRGNEHTFSPRLKVEVDGKLIPVEISDDPKIPNSVMKNGAKEPRGFSYVKNYVKKYKDILLAHFYGELDEEEVYDFIGKESEADKYLAKFHNYVKPKQDEVKIMYHFNTDDMIFDIDVVVNGDVIYSDYAIDRKELFQIANSLKKSYDAVGIYEE